jgi:hypothetical protein
MFPNDGLGKKKKSPDGRDFKIPYSDRVRLYKGNLACIPKIASGQWEHIPIAILRNGYVFPFFREIN